MYLVVVKETIEEWTRFWEGHFTSKNCWVLAWFTELSLHFLPTNPYWIMSSVYGRLINSALFCKKIEKCRRLGELFFREANLSLLRIVSSEKKTAKEISQLSWWMDKIYIGNWFYVRVFYRFFFLWGVMERFNQNEKKLKCEKKILFIFLNYSYIILVYFSFRRQSF